MKNIFTLGICLLLAGCGQPFGSAPPPLMFKSYYKMATTEDDVKSDMLTCGYKNVNFRLRSDTSDDIARRQTCMLKKGYNFTESGSYICDGQENYLPHSCRK